MEDTHKVIAARKAAGAESGAAGAGDDASLWADRACLLTGDGAPGPSR